MSGRIQYSPLVDSTSSLSLVLLPSLEISSLTAQGDDLTYERNDHELKIFLKEDLKKGDEQTFRIDYSGEMIANSGYDGYVGEEGAFMRPFAAHCSTSRPIRCIWAATLTASFTISKTR